MTHRGPFQPLPFCDSVILSFQCFAAEQDLHSIKAFSVSHSTPTVSRLQVGKRLRHSWDS